MTENEIATIIVNKAYNIHIQLGLGLLESIYEEVMFFELEKVGLYVERQKALPVI